MEAYDPNGERVQFTRSADGKEKICGYAVLWYKEGKPETETRMGKVIERVRPGCMNNYIRSGKRIPILLEHNKAMELGASDQEDTTIRPDDIGVWVEVEYDDHDPYHQIVRSKKRKVSSLGWSFNAWGKEKITIVNGQKYRTIDFIDEIEDFAIVGRPQYKGTSGKVFIRSEEEPEHQGKRLRDDAAFDALERTLRIKAEAKMIRERINKTTA